MQDRNAGNWQNHEITYYYLIFKAKSGFYASCACKAVYSLIPLIFSFKAAIYSQFSRVIINVGLGSPSASSGQVLKNQLKLAKTTGVQPLFYSNLCSLIFPYYGIWAPSCVRGDG